MKRTVIRFGCALTLAVTAHAVEIRNNTTGTQLFYDDFETNAVTPSTQNAYDSSVDADPIAKVGNWTGVMGAALEGNNNPDPLGCIQVTTSTTSPDPVPFQGGRDLRWYRDSTHNNAALKANLTSPQSTVGDVIHLSMRVYIPSSQNVAFRGRFLLEGSTLDFNSARAWVDINGAGFVNTVGTNFVTTTTSVPYLVNTWQEWSLDYVVGASTFRFSVDGVSGSGTSYTTGPVYDAEFINGSNTAGSFYLDVPEATSVAFLAMGVVLLWGARRPSRQE
jgi:hypothetical protein